MGVWDTVASVIVPRPDRFCIPSLEYLPYTKQNHRVRVFRQACAIDERRRMFRLYRWLEGKNFSPFRFYQGPDIGQDAKQVWFSGVHADVGGGYKESESALAKYPLIWMIGEAAAQKLRFRKAMFRHLALGEPVTHGRERYVAPDPGGMTHRSLRGLWLLLEIIPRRAKWLRWPHRWTLLGLYIPRGEPRTIPDEALIHEFCSCSHAARPGVQAGQFSESAEHRSPA